MRFTIFFGRSVIAFCALSSTASLVACSKENDVAVTNNNFEGLQTAVINANGGRLEGVDGLSVDVPPNAVSSTITIAGGAVDDVKAPPLPPEVTRLGLTYTLQPHGQTFGKQVSINIPFKTTGPSMKLYTAQPQGTWTAVAGAAPQGTTLRAQVDHFSFYVVVSEDPCIQGGKNAPDGTTCGTDKVCKSGQCQVCQAGGSCALAESECKEGILSCATGAPVCVSSSKNRDDGSSCGGGKVCGEGVCRACVEGATCTDAAFPCKEAAFTCGTGKASCEASATDKANGSSCGSAKTCFNGECLACDAGSACEGTNACKRANIACASGQPICEETDENSADGTPCGAGLFCLAGACGACSEGAACELAESPCKKASTSCSTGVAVCKATAANVDDGTACGAGKICGNGACIGCNQDAACVPTANPCHLGKTECGSGAPVCTDTGVNAAAGAGCGAGMTCDAAGACVKNDGVLSIVSGDGGTAMLNQQVAAPVILKLAGPGGSPLSGKVVKLVPNGAASAEPSEVTTNTQGRAVFQVRLGRKVGKYEFTASAAGAAPVVVSATATEPPKGTLIPLLNATLSTTAAKDLPALAVDRTAENATNIAVAKDGTVYLSQQNPPRIYRITPGGALEHVAGDAASVAPGDGGPAKTAKFEQVFGLELDEANNLLYVADRGTKNQNAVRLRVIDLTSGAIDYLGGDGTAGSPTFGDGGTMMAAFWWRTNAGRCMQLGPDGALYLADAERRLRRFDPVTTLITQWAPMNEVIGGDKLCDSYSSSAPAFDPAGNALFTAYVAKSSLSQTCPQSAHGLVRRTATGYELVSAQVAGSATGAEAQEGPAANSKLQRSYDIQVDKSGNIFVVSPDGSRGGVARIDAASGQLERILGYVTSAVGYPSDPTKHFGPAKGVASYPSAIGLDAAGHLYVAEGTTIRQIWKAGAPD